MTVEKRGQFWFGDSQVDIRKELCRYSDLNGYRATLFADAVCDCDNKRFELQLDDSEGAAIRTCVDCQRVHPIGDSDDYLSDANLESCECPCGSCHFEIAVGVSLYQATDDIRWTYIRWTYIGCRCIDCHLIACFGDWKSEYIGSSEYLARV